MNRYKIIEILSYVMFLSGIALWSKLTLPWEIFKVNQLLHILICIAICLFLFLPFMMSHTNKHKKTIMKRNKSYKKRRQTFLGLILMFSFIILLASGIYLFTVGNRGGDIYGEYSNLFHFYISFVFLFTIIYHSYYLGRSGIKEDKKRLAKLFNKDKGNQC